MKFFIQENAYKTIVCEMAAILLREEMSYYAHKPFVKWVPDWSCLVFTYNI